MTNATPFRDTAAAKAKAHELDALPAPCHPNPSVEQEERCQAIRPLLDSNLRVLHAPAWLTTDNTDPDQQPLTGLRWPFDGPTAVLMPEPLPEGESGKCHLVLVQPGPGTCEFNFVDVQGNSVRNSSYQADLRLAEVDTDSPGLIMDPQWEEMSEDLAIYFSQLTAWASALAKDAGRAPARANA